MVGVCRLHGKKENLVGREVCASGLQAIKSLIKNKQTTWTKVYKAGIATRPAAARIAARGKGEVQQLVLRKLHSR